MILYKPLYKTTFYQKVRKKICQVVLYCVLKLRQKVEENAESKHSLEKSKVQDFTLDIFSLVTNLPKEHMQ